MMVKWGKEMEEEMVEVRFRQGEDIEIGSNEVGFKGSWYAATVLHSSSTPSRSASKIMKKVLVQYQTLLKDEQGSNPLTEYVAISRVRPRPPPPDDVDDEEEENRWSFEVDEAVEAFYNDGWWEGTIMQVLKNQKYRVFFRDSNEEIEFHQSEIRRQLNWINGRWAKAQKVQEVPVTPQDQSQIRSPRPAQSSQARRKLSKVENQSTPKKASSGHFSRSSSKKKRMQPCNTRFLQPCKKLKTAEGMKTPLSLMACPTRVMSSGASTEVDGRYDFTTLTIKGKRTRVARKRKSFRALAAIFVELSSEQYSKDHPNPLDSYHKKPKHSLESNGSGDHPSVQGFSSQLPLKTVEVEQHTLVGCPKTKVLVQRKLKLKPLGGDDMKLQKMGGCSNQMIDVCNRKRQTTAKDSSTKTAVKGGKHKAAQRRSQAPASQTQTQTIGPEETTPCKETTIVVHKGDTLKETEKDGASSDIRDLDQPLSMLFQESCLKGRVQRQKKLKVRPRRRERKPLGGDNMKLQIMEGGSNQTIDVFNQRKQSTAKDSSTETTVKGGKHKAARGRSQAAAAQTQTQTIGLEETTPSKETTIVVHREDTLKETEKDGTSSDISDLDQPLSMFLQESCLPPIIGEKGVSSDNQSTVQSSKAINGKDAATRGLELQKSSIVVESSFSLEDITADIELDVAVRDEHNDMHLSWPFVKCSPLWEVVESWGVFRSIPHKLHFHPLEQYKMDLREGHAIGCMVNFANLVENMRKSQIEDPLSELQEWSKALDDLEGHGFNVQPIRARLKELIRLKDNYEHFVGQTKFAEEQIRVLKNEKEQLAARLVEVNKEFKERAEIMSQLKKELASSRIENKLLDSEIGKLMRRRHEIREGIGSVELMFDISAAAPW